MTEQRQCQGWFARLCTRFVSFARDELGSEVVEFALVIPIVVGLVWTSFEFWQLLSLRASVRTTTSQVARFITAYAAPPDTLEDAMRGDEACWRISQLIDASLRNRHGNMGDALAWDVHFYKILDANSPYWEGNVGEMDCLTLFAPGSGLQCNDQFGVKLNVSVPWLEVIFGLTGSSTNRTTISFSDTAVGAAPCMPYGDVRASGGTLSCGPGGGQVEICWTFDASFVPDLIEVYRGNPDSSPPVYTQINPSPYGGCSPSIIIPVGASTLTVKAYGGDREMYDSVVLTCP